MDLETGDYLMIGTLEAYEKMVRYYGAENILPLYVEVEDGERLARALARRAAAGAAEVQGAVPPFPCGRGGLFGGKAAPDLGIQRRFRNEDIEHCLEEITEVIYNGKL